ncbi:diacylglycerol kinase [Kaistia sp. 32K]|uniref:diacylglycerol kinase n=1 Tax=Kaistia sp. 32K TaxID=2795690 RepID=UPI00191668B2|nr:diacylglycerol kinase [Kaistia sp. 32K]BCP52950.1 diacylglycerol kinase [Kaistia sp. 32K]
MRAWLEHLIAASRWSASGVAILFRGEMAARMELAAAVAAFAWIVFLGRSLAEIGVYLMLAFATFSVEALNTAIEEIVDRVSPERSEFARRAKDLGSAAVMFMLLGTGIYVAILTIATLLGR